MKVTADTNVLVRTIVMDDPAQARAAQAALAEAEIVVVTIPTLCELVWILARQYRNVTPDIARTIRILINSGKVVPVRRRVAGGRAWLAAGGACAAGGIAFEGARLDGGMFLSFDRKAVVLIEAQGDVARLLD